MRTCYASGEGVRGRPKPVGIRPQRAPFNFTKVNVELYVLCYRIAPAAPTSYHEEPALCDDRRTC